MAGNVRHDAPSSASSQTETETENIIFGREGSDNRHLKPVTFRQRLRSLPLNTPREHDLYISRNHPSKTGNQLAREDEKKLGGLKGFIRKASVSIKNRQRRFSQMSSTAYGEVGTQSESPWLVRLRTATSFNRNSSALSMNFDADAPPNANDENMTSPVPGSGNRPPRIPKNGGSAARQNAALHNGIGWGRQRSNSYLAPLNISGEGDRESAIAMPYDSSDQVQDQIEDAAQVQSPDALAVASSTINRDFISELPVELGLQILSHVDTKTLRGLFLVSKRWSASANSTHVWREVFLREESQSYATGMPVPMGAGFGLPALTPRNDWMELSKARHQLRDNWEVGTSDASYLHGHLDSIYCVQFDENKIITGSRDKTIRVWDLEKLTCSLVIGPPSVVGDPSIMTDNEGKDMHYVATTVDSDEVGEVVRGAGSKPKLVSFPMFHEQSILCLQYDDEILVTGSSDGTSIIYDLKDGYKPTMRLYRHTGAVLDLAFDRKYIVTCSKDVTICVWDRQTGQIIKQLRGHNGPVNAVSLRGNTIVSCSGDFTVKMWNIETGNVIQTLRHHTKGLACSQFSEDSKYIASAGNDKLINVWNANTQQLIYTIDEAHDNLVRSLHIDSISGRLISGSYDSGIKVFSLETGQELLHFPHWHSSWVLGAKSDYRRIISTGQDPKILILDFGKGIKNIDKLRSQISRVGLDVED